MDDRMRALPTRLATTTLALLLAACGGVGGTASSVPSSQPPPSASAAPSLPSGGAVPADVLAPVIADAAARTGAPAAAIGIVKATPVTWNDGALGCPKPGVLYTQALVDGWQVIVEAAGKRIDYRVTGPGRFKVCEGILSR
jgi:hypothetical protein